ncbi:MAG: hypothetical protein EPN43_07615 [Jatrophihabitans sp.]|nr:MAG: hypothetical protein EPN43_07615 [Jatrophihabitans sp.]
MAKSVGAKSAGRTSRVPAAVGAIPVVGDLVKQADSQAQWLHDVLEQNARLVGQFPATLKAFNDSLDQFNRTIGRLDRAVGRVEAVAGQFTGPLDHVRELPDVLDALRREALPALRAATDTQTQVALLTSTLERILTVLGDLPGAGILRRLATGRPEADTAGHSRPGPGEPGAPG